MNTINARGRSCPEPVIMAKAAVDRGEEELEVLLDNPVSASNVMRFLEGKDYGVLLKDDDGMLTIFAHKKNADASAKPNPQGFKKVSTVETPKGPSPADKPETFSVLVTAQHLGRSDPQLGEVLMKSFLGTLAQLDNPPTVVALMNEGVKLALYDSSPCDHLKNLEKKGVAVLVCGTCVNHFGIAEQIGVGDISNMFEIIESLNKASKIVSL